jgi:hypothetical protein
MYAYSFITSLRRTYKTHTQASNAYQKNTQSHFVCLSVSVSACLPSRIKAHTSNTRKLMHNTHTQTPTPGALNTLRKPNEVIPGHTSPGNSPDRDASPSPNPHARPPTARHTSPKVHPNHQHVHFDGSISGADAASPVIVVAGSPQRGTPCAHGTQWVHAGVTHRSKTTLSDSDTRQKSPGESKQLNDWKIGSWRGETIARGSQKYGHAASEADYTGYTPGTCPIQRPFSPLNQNKDDIKNWREPGTGPEPGIYRTREVPVSAPVSGCRADGPAIPLKLSMSSDMEAYRSPNSLAAFMRSACGDTAPASGTRGNSDNNSPTEPFPRPHSRTCPVLSAGSPVSLPRDVPLSGIGGSLESRKLCISPNDALYSKRPLSARVSPKIGPRGNQSPFPASGRRGSLSSNDGHAAEEACGVSELPAHDSVGNTGYVSLHKCGNLSPIARHGNMRQTDSPRLVPTPPPGDVVLCVCMYAWLQVCMWV